MGLSLSTSATQPHPDITNTDGSQPPVDPLRDIHLAIDARNQADLERLRRERDELVARRDGMLALQRAAWAFTC